MSKIIKNVNISWAWEGDTYALQGFNIALTPYGGNPNETVIYKTFVDKKNLTPENGIYHHKIFNVVLERNQEIIAWVQTVYESNDSDWVSTAGMVVSDDGTSTIATEKEVNEKIFLINSRIETIEGELVDYQTRFSYIEQDLNGFESQVGEFQQQLNSFSSQISTFSQEVDGFRMQVSNFSEQLTKYNEEISEFNDMVNEYQEQVSSYTEQVSEFSQTVDGFESQVQHFEQEINKYSQQVSQFQQDVQGFSTQVSNLQSTIDGYEQQLSEFQQDVDGFRTVVESYEEDIENYSQQISQFQQNVQSLSSQVSNLQQTIDSYEVQISEFQQTVDGFKFEVQEFEQQLNQLTPRMSTIEQTAERIELEVFDEKGNSRIRQLSDEIDLKVNKDEIISEINLSDEGILISGNKIDIEGNVIFSSLTKKENGETVIDGSKVKTGIIESSNGESYIDLNTGNVNLKNKIIVDDDGLSIDYSGDKWLTERLYNPNLINDGAFMSGTLDAWTVKSEPYRLVILRHAPNGANAAVFFGCESSQNIRQDFDLEPNTTYTISFWAYVYDSSKVFFNLYERQSNSTRLYTIKLEEGSKYYSKTFTTGDFSHSGYISVGVDEAEELSGTGLFKVSFIKLEKGEVATGWAPSINELSNKYYVNSSIEQTKDEIDLKIKNISEYNLIKNGTFNYKSDYFKFWNKHGEISVFKTSPSSEEIKIQGYAGDSDRYIYQNVLFESGKTYTLSFNVRDSNIREEWKKIFVSVVDKDGTIRLEEEIEVTNKNTRHYLLIRSYGGNKDSEIRFGGLDDEDFEFALSYVMLEEGNRVNERNPFKQSIEDVVSRINLSDEGVLIEGKKIQLTGDTVVDGTFLVTNDMIADGIQADKITTGIIKDKSNINLIDLDSGFISFGKGKFVVADGDLFILGGLVIEQGFYGKWYADQSGIFQQSYIDDEGVMHFTGLNASTLWLYTTFKHQLYFDGDNGLEISINEASYPETRVYINKDGVEVIEFLDKDNGKIAQMTSEGFFYNYQDIRFKRLWGDGVSYMYIANGEEERTMYVPNLSEYSVIGISASVAWTERTVESIGFVDFKGADIEGDISNYSVVAIPTAGTTSNLEFLYFNVAKDGDYIRIKRPYRLRIPSGSLATTHVYIKSIFAIHDWY